MVCVTEGCNNLLMSSTDASQQRLYSSASHVSPSKSVGSCVNKRPTSTASTATSPSSSGVLKNVVVSHHMDRSSSTPRLTLKFHHVKRHENGVAAATDISRLHSGADSSSVQSSAPISTTAGGKTTCTSYVDSQYHASSSLDPRYHRSGANSESHPALKNNMSVEQPSAPMPFSPQFEDISDAEDDVVRPTGVNSRDPVCTAPGYGLPQPASHCMAPLSSRLCLPAANSTFCGSTGIPVSSSYLPITASWNNYSELVPHTAMSLLPPTAVGVGQPSGRMVPWVDENRMPMGVVNHLLPIVSSNGLFQTADAHLSSKQSFSSNRFAVSDGVGCLKSEFSPLKSEVLHTKALDHHSSFKFENYNGHLGDVKTELYIKPNSPVSHSESSQPCRTTFESKSSFLASQTKSEEPMLSNSGTFAEGYHSHQYGKDILKTDSCDSDIPSLHNNLRIKPDVDNSSPSSYNLCHHSPAGSVSPSLQSSCLEPDAAVNSSTLSAQVGVSQIANSMEPKVPPLRIIIPSKVCSSGSLSDGSNTNTASRGSVSSLPYIAGRTHSADSDILTTTAADEVQRSDSSPAVFVFSDNDRLSAAKEASASFELVPAKRRKIKHSSKVSLFLVS